MYSSFLVFGSGSTGLVFSGSLLKSNNSSISLISKFNATANSLIFLAAISYVSIVKASTSFFNFSLVAFEASLSGYSNDSAFLLNSVLANGKNSALMLIKVS
ncbi:hypothetical protein [Mycoplasmopsis cynos]|uniref:hypothetical protein n=1 Tax=Mycoplasmopsis cynos TaxID=171284 RepID=UPI00220CEDF7|nr:hypothetical protein [Mycoplasmopsis cynos]UWV92532.1 hypothetical protein NWE57_00055 [Mycoplasmopsis cynos]WAM05063.1 hypothetical protein ONA01_02750 [Mycoplasmopsis cynos]